MTSNPYDIGDVVRVSATFTNSAGVNTDPTTVTLKVMTPTKVSTTYTYALAEVIKSATGIYYRDVSLTISGEWFYRFEGTGTVESAEEANLYVRESVFA